MRESRPARADLAPGMPEGAEVAVLHAADGAGLRVARWTTPGARALVLVLQGRSEAIEKYGETIAHLLARNLAVVSFDWRGQGGSARELRDPRKGHVGGFDDYGSDLAAVLASLPPGLPRHALAHSMGATVLLRALAREPGLVSRAVLLAPMLRLHPTLAPPGSFALAELLGGAGLGRAYVPRGSRRSIHARPFAGNRLTSDPVRYARNAAVFADAPGLALGDPTIGWLRAAGRAMAELAAPGAGRLIRTPLLLLAGTEDRVTATPATDRFAATLRAGHGLIIPGARHELLMERDALRDRVLAGVDAFIPGEG